MEANTWAAARALGRVVGYIVMLSFLVLVAISSSVNIYTSLALAPVISNIDQFIRQANVLYDLIYTYGCVTTQFIPAGDCNILRAGGGTLTHG